MAIIKCKMCGGDLTLTEGHSIAECEYCGSRQTVPTGDSEKKLTLFARANRLRAACEFDKAAGVYESIVADFPEEAEAYWGLVLCKYGIEYVDDPATGKKIPTCHRSSFNSILDDSDFEQAIENADAVAMRLYREEAKQIEQLRKGILEVSSNEQPYDIFICYKETDLNGDRTVDSVLAQDIYDALVCKGYRVFFSRITLEDKLGQAYEPYIFAALNSARIMLAVGTCYEYYNAVWVKNEWSRYLKIVAQDKSRYLIPCYKGIDAYDIPKEFAHLQGQDMSKVGAIQDLLRGIEKILPKSAPTAVVQEKVVVGGSGSNKIASLLDRGNMALEDGDWAKADSFFEDVLNNDSKNAQAYLGKTLAQEKCRTIDAFVRKRREASQHAKTHTLYLKPDEAHIAQMVQQYAIAGYVEAAAIRKLYAWEQSYPSEVDSRRQQYVEEQNFWAGHKWLSRAEKFATGAVAENLRREKKALLAIFAERVKKAEEAEAAAKAQAQRVYEDQLAYSDERVQLLHQDGARRQEKYYQQLLQIARTSEDVQELKNTAQLLDRFGDYQDSKNLAQHCRNRSNEIYYQDLLEIAKTSDDIQKLTETAALFDQLGDYQDSRNLAEHCRKRAEEERAKIAAAAEQARILKEKQRKAQQEKVKRVAIIAAIAVALVLIVTQVVIPNSRYSAAENLLMQKQYEEAIAAFEALDGYKNSEDMAIAIAGISQLQEGDYDSVIRLVLANHVAVMVEYDTQGGPAMDAEIYQDMSQYTGLATPEYTGYRFMGWTFAACEYGNGMFILSFDAIWSDGYSITYDLTGGTGENPASYKKDGEAVTLQDPVREGYTFLGWSGTDLNEITQNVTIPSGSYGNRKYTAHWQANTYTFTFDAAGGTLDIESMVGIFGTDYTLPIPTREYYTFAGWYDGNTLYKNGTWNQVGDVALKAQWRPTNYTVTYNLSGGTNSAMNQRSFTVETGTFQLYEPTRKGYQFQGWYSDSTYQTKVTEIPAGSHEDIVLYAKWEIITYTITYKLNGGSISGTKVTSFTVNDLPVTLPTATKSNMVFLNWGLETFDSEPITQISEIGDVTVVACFMDPNMKMEYHSSSGGYYSVSHYGGSASSVVIPAYYEGKPVKQIDSFAFSACRNLTSITMPDTITKIGDEAFRNCESLKTIVWSDSLESIGEWCFWYCKALTKLEFPSSLKSIGDIAFAHCTSLTSVTIPGSVTYLGGQSFSGCTALTTVKLGEGLKSIEYNAFQGCSRLTSVSIPDSVTQIDGAAFADCERLKKIIIPAGVKTMGSRVFSGCDALTIYCRATSYPIGWDGSWNGDCKVVWGYTGN